MEEGEKTGQRQSRKRDMSRDWEMWADCRFASSVTTETSPPHERGIDPTAPESPSSPKMGFLQLLTGYMRLKFWGDVSIFALLKRLENAYQNKKCHCRKEKKEKKSR